MATFILDDPRLLTDRDLCRLINDMEPTETGEYTPIGAALLKESERRDRDL